MAAEGQVVTPQVVVSRAGFRRGLVAGLPLASGSLAYGAAYGLLASSIGLGLVHSLALSAAVNSGSAQTVAAAGLQQQASLAAVVLAVLMVNARYVVYGASLRPWMATLPWTQAYPALFLLGDANWLLSERARAAGEADAGFLVGSGAAMYVAWLAGTLAGWAAGDQVTSPQRLGLDFLLVAFCCASVTQLLWEEKVSGRTLISACAAFAASLLMASVEPIGWPVIAAAVSGVVTAYALFPGDVSGEAVY